MTTALSIDALEKRYQTGGGQVAALRGLSLDVEGGHLFTLLGPSGCGKSTTLRCVAGLERPETGEIVVEGRPLFSTSAGIDVPAHQRSLGVVFQSYALWPHMDVFQTVAFPLEVLPRARRPAGGEIRERVERVLATVGLEALLERPATDLSGGQQQRLALARALVVEPPLLLMDEPLSSLDAQLREQMRIELKRLQRELGITVLYVTHDQSEALAISNRVAVMRDGAILQVGKPREVYERPSSRFVAEFVGHSNLLEGQVARPLGHDRFMISTHGGELEARSEHAVATGARVLVSVRAEQVLLQPRSRLDGRPNALPATVRARAFGGDAIDHVVAVGGREITARTDTASSFPPGTDLAVELPAASCLVVPDEVG